MHAAAALAVAAVVTAAAAAPSPCRLSSSGPLSSVPSLHLLRLLRLLHLLRLLCPVLRVLQQQLAHRYVVRRVVLPRAPRRHALVYVPHQVWGLERVPRHLRGTYSSGTTRFLDGAVRAYAPCMSGRLVRIPRRLRGTLRTVQHGSGGTARNPSTYPRTHPPARHPALRAHPLTSPPIYPCTRPSKPTHPMIENPHPPNPPVPGLPYLPPLSSPHIRRSMYTHPPTTPPTQASLHAYSPTPPVPAHLPKHLPIHAHHLPCLHPSLPPTYPVTPPKKNTLAPIHAHGQPSPPVLHTQACDNPSPTTHTHIQGCTLSHIPLPYNVLYKLQH